MTPHRTALHRGPGDRRGLIDDKTSFALFAPSEPLRGLAAC